MSVWIEQTPPHHLDRSSPIAPLIHSQVAWSQTDEEVEVTIALPKGVRSRDIAVTIKSSLIQFRLKNGYSMHEGHHTRDTGQTLLGRIQSGLTLFKEIDPGESTWSLVDGQLTITLNKKQPKLQPLYDGHLQWDSLYKT